MCDNAPTVRINRIASQMNVSVRECIGYFAKELSEDVVSRLRGRIDGTYARR